MISPLQIELVILGELCTYKCIYMYMYINIHRHICSVPAWKKIWEEFCCTMSDHKEYEILVFLCTTKM